MMFFKRVFQLTYVMKMTKELTSFKQKQHQMFHVCLINEQ